MPAEVLEVIHPGLAASIQDLGRFGWAHYGVPVAGPMDEHAARWANELLSNSPNAPLLELLLQGAKLKAREDLWIVVAGAQTETNVPMWQVTRLHEGDLLQFGPNHAGVWLYLAVEGGFASPQPLGSASTYGRAALGQVVTSGEILSRSTTSKFRLPTGVASRAVAWSERRDYTSPPLLRVWPAPQWDFFSEAERFEFFQQEWEISPQSDRVGYRLEGGFVKSHALQLISEPVRLGTIQIPESGHPIVTMRDGPTVGGYPKIGLVDPQDLSWLAQCRPGQKIRFTPAAGKS